MTGVYGIMAYAVRQRTHEIGIRMALGAKPRDVLRLVIVRGLLVVALGVAIGLAGSFALTRLLRTLLWGVTPTDPLTYFVVIVTLAAVAMLACYLARGVPWTSNLRLLCGMSDHGPPDDNEDESFRLIAFAFVVAARDKSRTTLAPVEARIGVRPGCC